MRLDPFKLERYLAQYEFTAPHQLSCSDCDGIEMSELLSLADGESRQLWESLTLGYTEAPGHPLLRSEIAGMYSGAGADDVLVAAPEELIFLAVNSIVRNGDHVVCTFPAYQSLYQIAEGMHCEVTFWQADEKQGWRFEPARLAEMIRPSTRLIVVNFPHNPTGALPSRDDFDAVVEIARRHNLTLLCDEMYRLLEYDEAARLPAAVEVYERAVSLSGMSKVVRPRRRPRRLGRLARRPPAQAHAHAQGLHDDLHQRPERDPLADGPARPRTDHRAPHDSHPAEPGGTECLHRQVSQPLRLEPAAGRDRLSAARPPRDAARRGALRGGGHRGRCGPRAVVDVRLRRPSRALRPRPGGLHRRAGRVRRLPGIEDRRRDDGRCHGRAGRGTGGAAGRRTRRLPSRQPTGPAAAPATPPPADALAEFAVEVEPAVAPPSAGAGEAPAADDPSLSFPASARDAHAEHDAVAEDTAPAAPSARTADAGAAGDVGEPAFGADGAVREPDAPDLPPGVARGQGLPPDFFDELDEAADRGSGAGEPSEIEVVSPGDIAPEAVFAKPSVAADDDQTPDREPPAPPPDQAAGAEPPAAEPPSGSSESIEPPPGSWGTIPPPDGTPGS